MKKRYLVIAAIAGAAWFLFRKKQAVDNLDIKLVGVAPDLSELSPQVTVYIQISNQTGVPLQVNGIAGELLVGATVFGTAVAVLPRQIPANYVESIPVKVRLFSSNLLDAVKDFLSSGGNFQFRGSVNFLNTNFPVNLSYKLI